MEGKNIVNATFSMTTQIWTKFNNILRLANLEASIICQVLFQMEQTILSKNYLELLIHIF